MHTSEIKNKVISPVLAANAQRSTALSSEKIPSVNLTIPKLATRPVFNDPIRKIDILLFYIKALRTHLHSSFTHGPSIAIFQIGKIKKEGVRKMKKLTAILAVAMLMMAAGTAMAIPLDPSLTRPITPGSPPSGENSLQTELNNIYGLGVVNG